jgi:hypothetical protein
LRDTKWVGSGHPAQALVCDIDRTLGVSGPDVEASADELA